MLFTCTATLYNKSLLGRIGSKNIYAIRTNLITNGINHIKNFSSIDSPNNFSKLFKSTFSYVKNKINTDSNLKNNLTDEKDKGNSSSELNLDINKTKNKIICDFKSHGQRLKQLLKPLKPEQTQSNNEKVTLNKSSENSTNINQIYEDFSSKAKKCTKSVYDNFNINNMKDKVNSSFIKIPKNLVSTVLSDAKKDIRKNISIYFFKISLFIILLTFTFAFAKNLPMAIVKYLENNKKSDDN